MRYDDEFEKIYRGYFRHVYKFFCRNRIADDEAQELAQQVFLNAWKWRERYRGEAIKAYLEEIAINVLRNRYRRLNTEMRRMEHESIEKEGIAAQLKQEPPDHATRDRISRAAERIRRVDPLDRQCFLLHVEGYTNDEIARILRLPTANAVNMRLRKVRAILDEEGL